MIRGSDSQVVAVKALIAKLPPDSQHRIAIAAQTLRHMVAEAADKQDVEIAITLVLAELSILPAPKKSVTRRH
jgi:hypothetical protein